MESKQKKNLSYAHMLGKKHSEETKMKMSLAHLGKRNGLWKGDQVGNMALHIWIRNNLPVPKQCQDCGKQKRLDAACITGIYSRDFNNWRYLCRSCHMHYDNTITNLKQYR